MIVGNNPIFRPMATILEVQKSLNKIIQKNVKHSVFLWGPPGIGKSSIVNKIAKDNNLELIDLRISQLAPTDIRGLPYIEEGLAHFAPPSFFPQSGSGILFLDEANMASPAMMGIAQQLILDRQVGDYTVPDGWYIFAAGNRVEDRAAVSQMPAPVANRFLHYNVDYDLDSFKSYAISNSFNEKILAFLNFRPDLLFVFNKMASAWPSPRTWEMANTLFNIDESIDAAVGDGAAAEFYSYLSIYTQLPDIDGILQGKAVEAPTEPSLMYAVCGALVSRCETAAEVINAMKWLSTSTTEDYTALFASDIRYVLGAKNIFSDFIRLMAKEPSIRKFMQSYEELIAA
jgi:hypothetical protein